jgi:hypothetical protein
VDGRSLADEVLPTVPSFGQVEARFIHILLILVMADSLIKHHHPLKIYFSCFVEVQICCEVACASKSNGLFIY